MIRFSEIWDWIVVVVVVIFAASITILAAQTNDAPISKETNPSNNTNKGDAETKVELKPEDSVSPGATGNVNPATKVEPQQENSASRSFAVNNGFVTKGEFQEGLNELRKEYLDTRDAFLDRWMWLITALLALFGLIIPVVLAIISNIMGSKRIREFETEAEKSVEEARKLVEEIEEHHAQSKAHLQEMTSEEADDPDNAPEVDEAFQGFQADPEPSFIDKIVAEIHTLRRNGEIEDAIEKWRSIANIAQGIDNELAARAWLSIRYLLSNENEQLVAYNEALNLSPEYVRAYMHRHEAKYSNQSPHGIVVGAVLRYFSDSKFEKFSTELERRIGPGPYRADVVLYDESEQLVVAVECMRFGYIEEMVKDQLKEYFRHSDAQFGIFASHTDPSRWIFLKIYQGRIDEINPAQFETGVMESGSS